MPAGTIINGVADTMAVVLQIVESAKHELAFLAPPSLLSIAGTYGTVPRATQFIQNGGTFRGITTVSRANVEEIRIRLDVGEDLRHSDDVHELFMFVGDRKDSVSSINIGVEEYTHDILTSFWSENPVYAEYLLTSFESAWSQAIPAEDRIKEPLEYGEGRR